MLRLPSKSTLRPCLTDLLIQGFKVELLPSEQALRVTIIETIAGQTLPRSTVHVLESAPTNDGVLQVHVEDLAMEDLAKLTVQLSVTPVSPEEADYVKV